ncbi:MAG: DNA-processing protein DprA [Actinomycetota bacterium]
MRCRIISGPSAEYPKALSEIPDPPRRLYLRGRALGNAPAIAIVGTRRATSYGLEVAAWLAGGLSEAGLTVVSGMAKGIDAAAHRGALDAGGATVAVLGCGLDRCYPACNRGLRKRLLECGTLVSEHEPGTPPLGFHFPIRNRIIVGMTMAVVLVEAPPSGGAMITARLAGEFGRELFAVPGPIHSVPSLGPHLMLRQGARLAWTADQILGDLGVLHNPPAAQDSPKLPPDEQRVMDALDAHPMLLEKVAGKARMPASTTTAVLVRLEMGGLAARHPGGRYARAVGSPGMETATGN